MDKIQKIHERFHEKYTIDKVTGCWLWNKTFNSFGYGRFKLYKDGKKIRVMAHRLSWHIHHGRIPKGLLVLHKCDVPRCVNPDHLFLGNHKANRDDAVSKNRCNPRGGLKVTDAQVAELKSMRKQGHKVTDLAKLFSISYTHCSRIVNNRVRN